MRIENARGYKGDNKIVRVETERTPNGDLVEYQYNREGVCLVAKTLEWGGKNA